MRIGLGYDVHRLVTGRKLVLGGVTIPYEKGLDGHSDADVLLHAICDALLGAAAEGDIGSHFPDSDPAFKGIYSIDLLARTNRIIAGKGLRIVNLDATVIAQAPKLQPYKQEMVALISKNLKIDADRINIKATTTEGLGFTGQGEGIAAMCAALLTDSGP